jgi:hypothetical protein
MFFPQYSGNLTKWKVVYTSTFLALMAYERHFMLHGPKTCCALKVALLLLYPGHLFENLSLNKKAHLKLTLVMNIPGP